MKKGIIALLVISIMLLVGLTKVNALSWDVSNPDQHKLWDNDYFVQSADIAIDRNLMFTYPYNSGTRDVQVFSFTGMTWVENGWSESDSYHKFITGYSKYIRVTLITNSVWTQCEIQNNLIVCPVQKNVTVQGLKIKIDLPTSFSDAWQETALNIYQWANGYTMNNNQAIIDNQNQNTQQILEQNATYQDTPSQDMTNETQELDSFEQAEQGLLNSLDLNMSVMDGITINPNASAYIWQIVDRLRQINPAIILLMTSILGMGIIKMVLNR